ncbi:MAG: anthranilate phosphoribosyltransferase [Planctomycetaceae bacterium]|nr:anthranilate phosphoribosyltransferase [Planctomycetaceae bacterium]
MTENPLALAMAHLEAGESLTTAECHEAIASILDGKASDELTRALLTALHRKGESAAELLGAVRAIRERMIAFDMGPVREASLDTCGTGGDGAHTVNVSTAAAIVVAACGVPVVKHGNRAASGKTGSADVLGALGVSVDVEPGAMRRSLNELSIAFLFAPRFHPGLNAIAPVRRQLPFRTIFNLVGPLCNPAGPTHQLVGVPSLDDARRMAEVLAASHLVRRALVVTGSDGLDEVTLAGPTHVLIVEGKTIREAAWTPDRFSPKQVRAGELTASGPEHSAELIMRMLGGEPGPVREVVLANAAAALWTVDPEPLTQAVKRAAEAIDSGAAADLVARWSKLIQEAV